MSNSDSEYLVRVLMPEGDVYFSPHSSFKDALFDLEESLSDGAEKAFIYRLFYIDSK